MIRREQTFKIGHLGKFHGLNGEINFYFDSEEFIKAESKCLFLDIEGILVPFFIEDIRLRNNQQALVKFEDIDSHEKMPHLQSCDVYYPIEYKKEEEFDFDDLEGNDLWEKLIGFKVIDQNNIIIGMIKSIDTQTINTLLLIENTDTEDLIIPAVCEWIINLDSLKKQIYLNLPEGLI